MSVSKEAAYFDSMDSLSHWGFERNACDRCGKPNSEIEGLLMQCSRCRNAYYCSVDCFTADMEEHSKWCQVGVLPPATNWHTGHGQNVNSPSRKKAGRVSLTSVLGKDCEGSVGKTFNAKRSVSSEPSKSPRKKTSTRHSVSSEPGRESPGSPRKKATRKSVSSEPGSTFENSPGRTKKVVKKLLPLETKSGVDMSPKRATRNSLTPEAVHTPRAGKTKKDHQTVEAVTSRKKKATRNNVPRETGTMKTPTKATRNSLTLEAVLTPGKKKAMKDSQTIEALLSPRKKKATRNSLTLEAVISTRKKETRGKSSASDPGCKLKETPGKKATRKNLTSDTGIDLKKLSRKVRAKKNLYLDNASDVDVKKKGDKSLTRLDHGSNADSSPRHKKPNLIPDPRGDTGESPRRKKAARNNLALGCSSDYAKSPKKMSITASVFEATSSDIDKMINSQEKKASPGKPKESHMEPHVPGDKTDKAGMLIAFDWGEDSISGYGSEEDDPFLVESLLGPADGGNESPESSFSGEIETCGGLLGQPYSSFNNSGRSNFSLREKATKTKIGEDGNAFMIGKEGFARSNNDNSFSQLSSVSEPRRLRAPPESRGPLIREMSRKSLKNDLKTTKSSSLNSCSHEVSSSSIESDDDSGGMGYLDHLDSSKRQRSLRVMSDFDPWIDDDDEDDYDDQTDQGIEEDAALGSSRKIRLRRSPSRSRLMRSPSKGRRIRSYSNVARAEGETTDSPEPEWVRKSPLKQSSRGMKLREGVCSGSDLVAPVPQGEEATESSFNVSKSGDCISC